MKIVKTGMAGTMESSDINIVIEKNHEPGIKIHLTSSVEKQFGDQIREVILDTLKQMNIDDIIVRAVDRGALDCTIRARVQSAVMRAAMKENEIDWGLF
ncbi:citrate lyase acyl carrier protein [Wukongibacter sp. M2B1]|uniref:citrate lyase acyl carrier protein n=1 Tax=Wukongibacter sp. M2B1 TaxID=3088895 RepID=UPI003D796E94